MSELYSEICKMPLLTKDTEKELLDTYFGAHSTDEDKNKAKSTLLGSHRRFAFNEAKKRSNGDSEQFEELYNSGCEGLAVGLSKFDNDSGMRFLTYAGWWVYQRQMKTMSEFRLVSLPTQKQQLSVRIKKFSDSLKREPTIAELCEQFPDSTEKDLKELSQIQYLTFYFDNVNEEDIPVLDGLSSTDRDILEDQMYSIIDEFHGDEPMLIKRMYGLTDEGRRDSYSSIQKDFPSLSRQYLKDLKERALTVLTDRMS